MSLLHSSTDCGLILEDLSNRLITVPETNTPERLREVQNPEVKLIVKSLCKSFPVSGGRFQALKDINLTIKTGELVCLVGPSGCGKTTLLNILAGLEKPDYGKVINYDKTGEKPTSGGHLLIFQEASLFPWLNVFDNIAYGLRLRKVSEEICQEAVLKYLSLVQLRSFKDAYIHQLSGGMKQRVALARALVLEPEILLMDEPFSALDIQTRQEMYRLLLEIWRETRKTILFITHNVDEALVLSNRVLVMRSHPGEIKKEFLVGHDYPRILEEPSLAALRYEIIKEFAGEEEFTGVQGGKVNAESG